MLSKAFKSISFSAARRAFTTNEATAQLHKKTTYGNYMEPKLYENEFMGTNAKEIEFVRSPFYDLAKVETMTSEEVNDLLDQLTLKMNMIENKAGIMTGGLSSKDETVHERYADDFSDDKSKHIF